MHNRSDTVGDINPCRSACPHRSLLPVAALLWSGSAGGRVGRRTIPEGRDSALAAVRGAAELDTPVRFSDPAEAAATLAIRAGDPTGLDFYATHGRFHTPAQPPDAA